VDLAGVRAFAADRLPSYMVPDLVAVDALPLSKNGKIDRPAVTAMLGTQVAGLMQVYETPRTDVESVVADLFGALLGVDKVSRTASFFALGGDSLLATRAVERLRRRYGDCLSLRRLFLAPTVAEVAAAIEAYLRADRSDTYEEGVL
jgi:acyl carrier protein